MYKKLILIFFPFFYSNEEKKKTNTVCMATHFSSHNIFLSYNFLFAFLIHVGRVGSR